MKVLSFALLATLSANCIASADEPRLPKWVVDSGPAWQPPPGGIVRDQWAAIEIAHAAWFSLRCAPQSRCAQPLPEVKMWQKEMTATLKDGVWEVTEPIPANAVGGSLFVFISQKDGRILDVLMTQ